MNQRFNINRAENIINQFSKTLDLSLVGYSILTEVGTGLYSFMPITPLMAGAKKVMAWTQDSIYGSAESAIRQCRDIFGHDAKRSGRSRVGRTPVPVTSPGHAGRNVPIRVDVRRRSTERPRCCCEQQ